LFSLGLVDVNSLSLLFRWVAEECSWNEALELPDFEHCVSALMICCYQSIIAFHTTKEVRAV
jgi:hypothetical protein